MPNLLHIASLTATAPALQIAGAQHRPSGGAAIVQTSSASFLSQPSGSSEFPGRGRRGLRPCRVRAPSGCAGKGVSWPVGLQGASPRSQARVTGAWRDGPWGRPMGPRVAAAPLPALRLEAQAALGARESLPAGPAGGQGCRAGRWRPPHISRAVVNASRVSQTA